MGHPVDEGTYVRMSGFQVTFTHLEEQSSHYPTRAQFELFGAVLIIFNHDQDTIFTIFFSLLHFTSCF